MSLNEYLADNLGRLLLHFVSMLCLSVFLLLTGTAVGIIIIVLIVWVLGLCLCMLADHYRQASHLRELQSIMDGLEQKYIFAECVPKPRRRYEHRLMNLTRRSGKAMIEAVSASKQAEREYQEYIENWVHEIKAPITAAQLMCSNTKSDLSRKLQPQLSQIEEHVERALYYSRSGSMENDLVVRSCCLAEIVPRAIGRHQALLIQNVISIETLGLDVQVYTDEKWLEFMLGQLLANAVRYHGENPMIKIEAMERTGRVRLCVTDNGIGIAPHDLPRVFDRGFTGSNGRSRGGATGMGLYICKRLASFLQIELSASSQEGEYTCISLVFPPKASD